MIKQKVHLRSLLGNYVSAMPRLSKSLLVFTLFIIATNLYLTLIMQPKVYWSDYGTAFSGAFFWTYWVISIHPLLYAVTSLGYVLILSWAFRRLPASVALALWLVVIYFHLEDLAFMQFVVLSRHFFFEYGLEVGVSLAFFSIILGVLGGFLARMFLVREIPANALNEHAVSKSKYFRIFAFIVVVVWLSLLNFALARAMIASGIGC